MARIRGPRRGGHRRFSRCERAEEEARELAARERIGDGTSHRTHGLTAASRERGSRGFVICRARSFAKADTFAGDDLHVRATFGRTPEVAQDGPEDKNLGFVSAPLVSLTKNEIVHVAVFDRDVFELTNLARVNVAYAGTPIVVAASAIAAVDEQKARVFDELRDGAVDETSRRRARIS